MTLRAGPVGKVLIVALSLLLGFLIDSLVQPRDQFVATPYAVSVLIATQWFSRRGILASAALAFLVAAYSAYLDQSPLVPTLLHLVSLITISVLALLLTEERWASARRAGEAEAARREITSILNSITDGFIAVDRDGRLRYLNATALRFLGRDSDVAPSELVGQNLWTSIPDLEGTPLGRAIREAITAGAVVSRETLFEPSGCWLEVRIYPAANGLSIDLRDVGARKREEEVRQRLLDDLRREQQRALALVEQTRRLNVTLRTVLDTMPAGVLLADARGAIVLSNPEANLILGGVVTGTAYGPRGGYSLFRLDGTPFPPRELPLPQAIEHGRATRDVEILVRYDNGFEVVISGAGSPERDPSGVITGAVAIIQDITARKRAEQERERLLAEVQTERARFQAIFECAFNGILYVDKATGAVLANPEMVRLLGRPIVSAAGRAQYVGDIRYPDGRPIPEADLPGTRALDGETPPRTEALVVRPDGTSVPVLDNAAPVRLSDGTIIGAVIVTQDISEIKAAERLREEWTSLVAHDLRQPVTVISGYADLLAKQLGALPPSARASVGHIVTMTRLLNRMIGDLLDVSRIEARRLTVAREEVDLTALLRDVVARSAEVSQRRPVRLEIAGALPRIEADPSRIEQVLANLISNAVKYGTPGTEIVVAARRIGREVEVSVTNTGPGIPPEQMARLFTRFYRTTSAQAGRVGGLGLGLYISRGLVEAMGGRIWAKSIPGQTTTFFITLPVSSDQIRRAFSS